MSSIVQKFRESDNAFGNASRFRSCLDFGPSTLRAAVVKGRVAGQKIAVGHGEWGGEIFLPIEPTLLKWEQLE